MIELKDVGKKYNNRDLFCNVNLKIENPGIYCFVGDNGVGKTTLLNIISLNINPSCGTVINKFGRCSFVSQKVNLLESLTLEEHFDLFNIDCNLLKRVHLFSKRRKYIKELSFGMKQRVAVLIGLHVDNSVIILDEPTSHLDEYNRNLLMNEIKKVSKNKIILLVSHDDKCVNKYSDFIYKIEDKKVLLIKNRSKKADIKKNKLIINRFGVYLRKHLLANKKNNLCYFLVSFILFLILGLSINLKGNLFNLLSKESVLDYNKFYLKECKKSNNGQIVIKECDNLSLENVNLLNESEHFLGLNYDVFLNYLYNLDNLNVIYMEKEPLKAGRYPKEYNEVIVSEGYSLGDEIVIEVNKVIRGDKIDIYNDKVTLKVVGICRSKPFVEDRDIYLDYMLIEGYLKETKLISNGISLCEYFEKAKINNYKYVLYFNEIDLNILKENNIEYVSLSYDYFYELEECFEKIGWCCFFISIFALGACLFYIIKLIKKRVKKDKSDILFFKSMGVNNKKIINMLNKENVLIILLSFLSGYICVCFILCIFFSDVKVSVTMGIFLLFLFCYISKIIVAHEVRRNDLI